MKWFRFYSEFRSDPKMRRMPIIHRYAFVVLLCLAGESAIRGLITGLDDDDIAYELEMATEDWLTLKAKFKVKGLIEFNCDGISIVNWKKRQFESDSSADRVARHRAKRKQETCNAEKQPCNVTGTLLKRHVTPSDTDPYSYSDPDPYSEEELKPKSETNVSLVCDRAADGKAKAISAQENLESKMLNPEDGVTQTPATRSVNPHESTPPTEAGVEIKSSAAAPKKELAREIKRRWFEEIFCRHYPYRLTGSGAKRREMGKVIAATDSYLSKLPLEEVESGRATEALRSMIRAGCEEYRKLHGVEPIKVTPKDSDQWVYALPYIPDPCKWFSGRRWLGDTQFPQDDGGCAATPTHPDWLLNPEEGFLNYLANVELPGRCEYRDVAVSGATARTWLNAGKYKPQRLDDARIYREAYQRHVESGYVPATVPSKKEVQSERSRATLAEFVKAKEVLKVQSISTGQLRGVSRADSVQAVEVVARVCYDG